MLTARCDDGKISSAKQLQKSINNSKVSTSLLFPPHSLPSSFHINCRKSRRLCQLPLIRLLTNWKKNQKKKSEERVNVVKTGISNERIDELVYVKLKGESMLRIVLSSKFSLSLFSNYNCLPIRKRDGNSEKTVRLYHSCIR